MQSWKTLAQVPIVHHTCTKHSFDGQQYRAKNIWVKPLAHLGKLRLLHSIITTQTRSQQSFKYRIGPAVIYRCYPALEKKICFHPSAAWNLLFWRKPVIVTLIFISLHMLFKIMAKSLKKTRNTHLSSQLNKIIFGVKFMWIIFPLTVLFLEFLFLETTK